MKSDLSTDVLSNLFKVLSNPDTIRILLLASKGIENSTHAMEELDITQKKYYARLRALVETGLVRKKDGVYGQTGLGRIFYDRFIPAMDKAYDAKDKLDLLVSFEGIKIESSIRKIIEDDLNLLGFAESTNVKLLEDYESLVIELIDQIDNSNERVLLASNYEDLRVIEAVLRSVKRGVNFKLIIGENSARSRLQNLRLMLSPGFAKAIIEFMSITDKVGDLTRVAELKYSFCVSDDSNAIYELTNPSIDEFLIAFVTDDRSTTEKLADSFCTLWEKGKPNEMVKFFKALKRS